ncbi:MAG: DNA primase small subunit domain-containing protein [Candidatus Pacearchaeota archaeon]
MDTKEERVRKLTSLYYSNPKVQETIFNFSKSREISARYFDSFGKRPDSFQYLGDIFEMVKKGTTSFHCSQEIWANPLNISTDMSKEELNELRTGWDLLIDIDSKYLDYSKVLVQQIMKVLDFHGVKNVGIKFSGSKGFHMIIPWKAFPKEINSVKTSDMFPEWPRILTHYISEKTKPLLIKEVSALTVGNKYIRDFEVTKEVMPDIILVSPRHLFRMPYSLHEKTALASIVLYLSEIENFQPKDASPLKVSEPREFTPDCKEGEARELLLQALDWHSENKPNEKEEKEKTSKKDYKPIKIENLSDKMFPPSIQKILNGVVDGRKRALFILLNLFRSIGMEREELEKRIEDWNKKNSVPLKEGYLKAQLSWGYRNKTVLPPNFDKDYYKGIGINPTEEEMRYKNPVNYIVKKNLGKGS